MKKRILLLTLVLMLSGCSAEETYETIADDLVLSAMVQPKEIYLELPEESAMPAMETDSGKLYLCEDYDITVQTLSSGDLDATVRSVSGYSTEDLTIIQTVSGEVDKYEFVWTSAGELGQQIGRATVLDDGNYHYVLTTTIDAALIEEYQEIWNGLFESFKLT